jgi:cysteine desulfurase
VDPQRFADAVTERTVMACLMHVNNELGTIQPVADAFAAVKRRAPRCLTFVDAVQSFTRVELQPKQWSADLVALSGHKVGGPRGIGALITLGRRPEPLVGGGDQEWGVRPGTENVPGAVGFVAAVQQKLQTLDERRAQAAELALAFGEALAEQVPTARINGDPDQRSDFILSVSVPGLPSEALLRGLDELGVCVSAGAACHARSQKQSHVLEAIGVEPRSGTIRVSFGPGNTVEQVRRAVAALAETVERYAIP